MSEVRRICRLLAGCLVEGLHLTFHSLLKPPGPKGASACNILAHSLSLILKSACLPPRLWTPLQAPPALLGQSSTPRPEPASGVSLAPGQPRSRSHPLPCPAIQPFSSLQKCRPVRRCAFTNHTNHGSSSRHAHVPGTTVATRPPCMQVMHTPEPHLTDHADTNLTPRTPTG